jgi:2-polyprenyl-3-methyl-5-hydroxy-6-metoxy-1,4-benzoquinol methylase
VNGSSSKRRCPFCGAGGATLLFDLSAEQFCSLNWTYSRNWRGILEIDSFDHRSPIVECTTCGFVFAGNLPSDEFLVRVYDQVIDQELAFKASREPLDIARRLVYLAQGAQLLNAIKEPKALDFGFGYGMTLGLLDVIGVRALGFDLSASRVSRAEAAGLNVTQSFDALGAEGPFDLLICDNVLEHVPNPREIIGRLASASATGAVMYVSVPAYERKKIRTLKNDLANGVLQDMALNPWEHLNYFNLRHLDAMLGEKGFSPIRGSALPGHPDIGLRAEPLLKKRLRNSAASWRRLSSYAINGKTLESVENRFYRFVGSNE